MDSAEATIATRIACGISLFMIALQRRVPVMRGRRNWEICEECARRVPLQRKVKQFPVPPNTSLDFGLSEERGYVDSHLQNGSLGERNQMVGDLLFAQCFL